MAKKRRKKSVTAGKGTRKQPRPKARARARARKRATAPQGRKRPTLQAQKRTGPPKRARKTPQRRIDKKPRLRLKRLAIAGDDLTLGQKVPNKPEKDVVGAAATKIVRGTAEFAALISNTNTKIVFKDE